MNKESLKQTFIDCAFYGYVDGLKAVLAAGRTFGEGTWLEALRNAALGGNAEVVRFILNQFVVRKRDITLDTDWLKTLDEKEPAIAREIDLCDRYVRAEKLRGKLKEYGIGAPEVPIPEFIDTQAQMFEFVEMAEDQGSKDASKGDAVFAQADQFGKLPPRSGGRVNDAQAVENWLAQTKHGKA